jgi:hypothetical protein
VLAASAPAVISATLAIDRVVITMVVTAAANPIWVSRIPRASPTRLPAAAGPPAGTRLRKSTWPKTRQKRGGDRRTIRISIGKNVRVINVRQKTAERYEFFALKTGPPHDAHKSHSSAQKIHRPCHPGPVEARPGIIGKNLRSSGPSAGVTSFVTLHHTTQYSHPSTTRGSKAAVFADYPA